MSTLVFALNKKLKNINWSIIALILPFILFFVLFIILPVGGLLLKGFTDNNELSLNVFGSKNINYTLENYRKLFTNQYYFKMMFNSIFIPFCAVLLSAIFGVPAAYVITRPNFKYRKKVRWFISIPIYVSSVVSCYALLIFLGPYGIVNEIMKNIFGYSLKLIFNIPAVILGIFYIIIPTYIRTVASSFEAINPDITEASLSLGGSPFYTFRKILLPLVLPGIFAASILTMSFSMGIVVVPLILGGGTTKITMLPLEIMLKSISFSYDIPFSSAMATVLLIIALGAQILIRSYLKKREKLEI
jgi:ABC-type spermidine/putrescine transport system permease subunit I